MENNAPNHLSMNIIKGLLIQKAWQNNNNKSCTITLNNLIRSAEGIRKGRTRNDCIGSAEGIQTLNRDGVMWKRCLPRVRLDLGRRRRTQTGRSSVPSKLWCCSASHPGVPAEIERLRQRASIGGKGNRMRRPDQWLELVTPRTDLVAPWACPPQGTHCGRRGEW
jgi:hypothetical protein